MLIRNQIIFFYFFSREEDRGSRAAVLDGVMELGGTAKPPFQTK